MYLTVSILGHRVVADIAWHFLREEIKESLSVTLGKGHSLSSIAAWADEIRQNPQYHWTAELHYFDVEDTPPQQCGIDPKRDKLTGPNVVSAIHNFTLQLNATTDVQHRSYLEALSFLVHFVGDLHQPLHGAFFAHVLSIRF